MKGYSWGIKKSPVRRAFLERFIPIAEERLGIGRHEHGFLRGIRRALDLPADSTAQRWLNECLPRIPHLLRIYEKWGITPNYLLGIEDEQCEQKRVSRSTRRRVR